MRPVDDARDRSTASGATSGATGDRRGRVHCSPTRGRRRARRKGRRKVIRKVTCETHRKVTCETHRKVTWETHRKVTWETHRKVTFDTHRKVTFDTHRKVTFDTHRKVNERARAGSFVDVERRVVTRDPSSASPRGPGERPPRVARATALGRRARTIARASTARAWTTRRGL
ncbi:hypothetical protein BE221DRAFT_56069, partial [Ostreococcus tauri]